MPRPSYEHQIKVGILSVTTVAMFMGASYGYVSQAMKRGRIPSIVMPDSSTRRLDAPRLIEYLTSHNYPIHPDLKKAADNFNAIYNPDLTLKPTE